MLIFYFVVVIRVVLVEIWFFSIRSEKQVVKSSSFERRDKVRSALEQPEW